MRSVAEQLLLVCVSVSLIVGVSVRSWQLQQPSGMAFSVWQRLSVLAWQQPQTWQPSSQQPPLSSQGSAASSSTEVPGFPGWAEKWSRNRGPEVAPSWFRAVRSGVLLSRGGRTPPLTFRTNQILPHTNSYFRSLYCFRQSLHN